MGNAKWLEQRTDSLFDGRENTNSWSPKVFARDWNKSLERILCHLKKHIAVCQNLLDREENVSYYRSLKKRSKFFEAVETDLESIYHKLAGAWPDWKTSQEPIFVKIREELDVAKRFHTRLRISLQTLNV